MLKKMTKGAIIIKSHLLLSLFELEESKKISSWWRLSSLSLPEPYKTIHRRGSLLKIALDTYFIFKLTLLFTGTWRCQWSVPCLKLLRKPSWALVVGARFQQWLCVMSASLRVKWPVHQMPAFTLFPSRKQITQRSLSQVCDYHEYD